MQLIRFLSILSILGSVLSLPAAPLDGHQATPVKREPGFPDITFKGGRVYDVKVPKPKPAPKPKPDPRPIYINGVPWVTPRPKPKPWPKPVVGKPYTWPKGIDPKIRYRAVAAPEPDKPVHILPYPDLGPPVVQDPEPEPEKPAQTTTTRPAELKPTPTPVKKIKWYWPAKVRPPYYQPGYGVSGVEGSYKEPVNTD
ncbi:hypothetical protein TWF281_010366 [Arthrobotrys megalospora]